VQQKRHQRHPPVGVEQIAQILDLAALLRNLVLFVPQVQSLEQEVFKMEHRINLMLKLQFRLAKRRPLPLQQQPPQRNKKPLLQQRIKILLQQKPKTPLKQKKINPLLLQKGNPLVALQKKTSTPTKNQKAPIRRNILGTPTRQRTPIKKPTASTPSRSSPTTSTTPLLTTISKSSSSEGSIN